MLSEARASHSNAVRDLAEAQCQLDALLERQGAAALAAPEAERRVTAVIEEAAGSVSQKTPLPAALIRAFQQERAGLDLLGQVRARLEFRIAEAQVALAQAGVAEAEAAVIVAGEELKAHLEAQAKAAQALAALEGGSVDLQIEGEVSSEFKKRLVSARDRADGARRALEVRLLSFEVRRLPVVAGGGRR
jgi:hypothetical protein